ncbi:nitroreductase/quinone reductase family protein [Amycolatopsis sp.]|uniref:nitroreductase/quinone reductase family protein n=1 Tax=Amycolatopsis sp. TaxID=37632 RepID=UPI002DF768F4|nr:nitroreductase/quinone reductase family protein [Amycolatopsis sp.]
MLVDQRVCAARRADLRDHLVHRPRALRGVRPARLTGLSRDGCTARLDDNRAPTFWLVSEYGEKSQYVRNIQAHNEVRVRLKGRWHTGTAHLLPDDDARARLKTLPRLNSTAVRVVGSGLLTLRIDLTS